MIKPWKTTKVNNFCYCCSCWRRAKSQVSKVHLKLKRIAVSFTMSMNSSSLKINPPHILSCVLCPLPCQVSGLWPLFHRQASCDLNRQMLPTAHVRSEASWVLKQKNLCRYRYGAYQVSRGETKVGIAFCNLLSPGMEKLLGFPSHVSLGCGGSLATLNPTGRVTVQLYTCTSYHPHAFVREMQISS